MKRSTLVISAALCVGLGIATPTVPADTIAPLPPATAPTTGPATKPVVAKELSTNVKNGLKWVVEHQQKSGGWSQAEESKEMGNGMDNVRDTSNVADTCMAAEALIRSGSTPAKGDYAEIIRKAVEFVCDQVEHSSADGLFVTDLHGTRVQAKLGQHIDTFAAALLLADVRNTMPDAASAERVSAALDKVMDKIEKNQNKNGTFAQDGWAPALADGMATKAINHAAQNGANVSEVARANAEQNAGRQMEVAMATPTDTALAVRGTKVDIVGGTADIDGDMAVAGGGRMGGGVVAGKTGALHVSGTSTYSGGLSRSAGVALYNDSSSINSMAESAKTNAAMRPELEKIVAAPATQPSDELKRKDAQEQLARFDTNIINLNTAESAVIAKLDDKGFTNGFGSNGGEEFLSYLNIGENLVLKGGENWDKWDKSMTENLNHIQNADGSWSGQHCITGRTFCTSAALMVLMVDRTATPVTEKIKHGQ